MLLENQSNAAKKTNELKKQMKQVEEERNQIKELLLEKQRKQWQFKAEEFGKQDELKKETQKTQNKYKDLSALKAELQQIKTMKLKNSKNADDRAAAEALEEAERKKKEADAQIAKDLADKKRKEE